MDRTTRTDARDVILDSIADGVFTVDMSWHITSFNRAAEEITGVSRQEALGQRCCDVFRSSICETACTLSRTLETGRPVINQAIYIINADGARVPISISTAILRDTDGRAIGGVETFRDLSTVEALRKALHEKYSFEDIIGRSVVIQRLFDVLPQLAESESTILLQGESGTGKELFARALHNLSPRRDRPFVPINCGALPDNLLESELFGYKAGAFTDARRDKPGRLAAAHTGTLFLDEVGDISPAMQVRLLRVLQERQYEPLGGTAPEPVDVRIVAATHRDLAQLVATGAFREDFYYRINVLRLELPPLRERREDIPLLVDHFLARLATMRGKELPGLSEEALAAFMAHDYPGNVRELANAVEHAFVLCGRGLIELQHLPSSLVAGEHFPVPVGATLSALEAMHIADALRQHQGNRTAAARELGIDPSTLYRKIRGLGVATPPTDGRTRSS